MTKTKSTKVLMRRTSKLHFLEIKKELAQLVRKREFKIGIATFILFIAASAILYRGFLRASPKSQVLSEGTQKQKKPNNPPVKKLADTTGPKKVSPIPTPPTSPPATSFTSSQNPPTTTSSQPPSPIRVVLTKNPESKKERVKDREKTLEKRKRSNEEKTQKKRHDKDREDD